MSSLHERVLSFKINQLIEANISQVKLYPFNPEVYSNQEIQAAKNYLKELVRQGELFHASEQEIDQMPVEDVLRAVASNFGERKEASGSSLARFFSSDILNKYKSVLNEKPLAYAGAEQKEFSAAGGTGAGSISGHISPIGRKTDEATDVGIRSFGGGKVKKYKKTKYSAKTGSVFPKQSKIIYNK